MLQRESGVVCLVASFLLYCVFGKGALEIFPAELPVDPELIFGVPPRIHDLSYLEAVFVFHLYWYSSELFGKAGPFCLGEDKALGAVVWCLFLVEDFSYEIHIVVSLHPLVVSVWARAYIYSLPPLLFPFAASLCFPS